MIAGPIVRMLVLTLTAFCDDDGDYVVAAEDEGLVWTPCEQFQKELQELAPKLDVSCFPQHQTNRGD